MVTSYFDGGWSRAPDPPFDSGGLKIGNSAGAARTGSEQQDAMKNIF
jgi:hypothetical protein